MNEEELNAAVAEKVMGWTLKGQMWQLGNEPRGLTMDVMSMGIMGHEPPPVAELFRVWSPATDHAHAFEVVEKMRRRGWYLRLVDCIELDEYEARFITPDFHDGSAGGLSIPRAICEAALKAIESEVTK